MSTLRVLDTFTLEFELVLLFIFAASLTFIVGNQFRKRDLQWSSVGFSTIAVGFLFMIIGQSSHLFLTYVLPSTLICAGYALSGLGLVKTLERPDRSKFYACLTVLATVSGMIFTFAIPSLRFFVVSSSLCLLMVLILTGYEILGAGRFYKNKTLNILGLLHLLFALFLGFRMHAAVTKLPTDLTGLDPSLKLYTLASLIFAVFFTGLIISYTAEDYTRKIKKHVKQLQQLTFTDPLTGVHNKRSAMRIMTAEKERISRYDTKCCIAIIDLDHFKSVNDTYGHLYGDHVLKSFSKIALEELRSFDTVARYGGEEFILVLPETDLYQGMLIADRLRKAVSGHKWDKPNFTQTICVGVIEINKTNCEQDIKHLVSCADEALYVAKKNGRNHVEAAVTKAYA